MTDSYQIHMRTPHAKQQQFIDSTVKRKIIRAGRRGGKTVGIAILACMAFLQGKRVLYAAPTIEQVEAFWYEVKMTFVDATSAKVLYKNETEHVIEKANTQTRLKAKTAWNADTLRGDYADLLILDEFQLMAEDTWDVVGAPMLMDNDGDAVFIYTPPSLHSSGVSKARDPLHAPKMFRKAELDESGRWETFHFASSENPHISIDALSEITHDMSQLSYRQEILAEDVDESWKGLIYKAFDSTTQVVPRFTIPDNWLIYVGHDFGGANPAAIFFAKDVTTSDLYAFHEYFPGGGRTPKQHVEMFKDITRGYHVMKRVGGAHQEEEVRLSYAPHGWSIKEPLIRHVLPQIEKVQAFHERGRIFVFEDMHRYLFEKANYSWKLDPQGQPTDEIQDKAKWHLMDAERYILSDLIPVDIVHETSSRIQSFIPIGR